MVMRCYFRQDQAQKENSNNKEKTKQQVQRDIKGVKSTRAY